MNLTDFYDPVGELLGAFGEFLFLGCFILLLVGLLAAPRAWLLKPVSPRLALVAKYSLLHFAVTFTALVVALAPELGRAIADWWLLATLGAVLAVAALLWGSILFAPREARRPTLLQ
jgi:ABC-type transport system involved in cytochrome c biogenesis permease subunit